METESVKAEEFKTLSSVDQPFFVLAQILAQKNLGVSIKFDLKDRDGNFCQDVASIYMSANGRSTFTRVSNSLEFKVLNECHEYCSSQPPETNSCQWGEDTKRRVLADYWQKKAERYRRNATFAKEAFGEKVEKKQIAKAQEAESKAHGLLDGLRPLTLNDVCTLLEETVDRVLVENKQTQISQAVSLPERQNHV